MSRPAKTRSSFSCLPAWRGTAFALEIFRRLKKFSALSTAILLCLPVHDVEVLNVRRIRGASSLRRNVKRPSHNLDLVFACTEKLVSQSVGGCFALGDASSRGSLDIHFQTTVQRAHWNRLYANLASEKKCMPVLPLSDEDLQSVAHLF